MCVLLLASFPSPLGYLYTQYITGTVAKVSCACGLGTPLAQALALMPGGISFCCCERQNTGLAGLTQ